MKSIALGTGIRLVWGLIAGTHHTAITIQRPVEPIDSRSAQYYPLHLSLALITFVIDVAGQSASTFLVIKERSVLYSFIGLVRLFLGLGLNIWLIVLLQVGLIGVFISP